MYDPDPVKGTSLVPDMATDLGTPNAGGTEWSFTLRDGLTWQDGSEVTCEDVKYGVSRTFANNMINQGPTYAVAYLDIPANPITDAADPKSAFLSALLRPVRRQRPGPVRQGGLLQRQDDHLQAERPACRLQLHVTLGFVAVPKAADTGETYGEPTAYLAVVERPVQGRELLAPATVAR